MSLTPQTSKTLSIVSGILATLGLILFLFYMIWFRYKAIGLIASLLLMGSVTINFVHILLS